MSAKHTPGPLKIAGRETRGLPHTLVAARTLLFRVYSEAYGDFDQETENARRLVACWNACEKVSTEDLEAITRPGDVSWAITIDRLVRERDELRAALESALFNKAAADIVTERQRQITVEGWTPEHDDEHTLGELVQAAADLCVYGTDFRVVDLDGDSMVGWGLTEAHRDNRRRQLVIAGALILAEIERLDRAAVKGPAA